MVLFPLLVSYWFLRQYRLRMKFYSIDRDQMNLNESIKASDERVMFQADKVE